MLCLKTLRGHLDDGLAVVWIFKTDVGGKHLFPNRLIYAALFIVSALAIDLLHYAVGSVKWAWHAKRPTSPENARLLLDRVGGFTFWFLIAKAAFIILAYGFLLWYLATHLYGPPRL